MAPVDQIYRILNIPFVIMADLNNLRRFRRERENRQIRQEELRKLYHTPANLRLKYIAIGAMFPVFVLMLIMIVWIDVLSVRTILFMRGCCGLFAIISVIVYAILVYRVNSAYQKGLDNSNGKDL